MARAMGSTTEGYIKNSPLHLIEKNEKLFATSDDLLDLWPRILLLHGQKDTTVGMDQSASMFNTLGKLFSLERRQELDVRMRLYKRMAHGEPVTCKIYLLLVLNFSEVKFFFLSFNVKHVCKEERKKFTVKGYPRVHRLTTR